MERPFDEVLREYQAQHEIPQSQVHQSPAPQTNNSSERDEFIEYIRYELDTSAVGTSRIEYRQKLMEMWNKLVRG